ncbi:hypothetical protein BDR26DRAFT_353881 [Obelidium mucronatum]|nr:hypothetical protein BDR26DRAFT_353881 [Obelidium mucronatum]
MLKTEIRRLQEERREGRKNNITDERSSQALERKYLLAKEMVTKLKQERQELQRTCFDLKLKADEMEKRYFDSQLMAKRMGERAGRTVGEIATRLSSQAPKKLDQMDSAESEINIVQPQSQNLIEMQSVKLPPPIWASLATTPRGSGSARTRTEPVPTDNTDVSSSINESSTAQSAKKELPDYAAWKLKIETLTTERTFLMHENSILKQRIDELGVKLSKSEKANQETLQKVSNLDKEVKAGQQQLKNITAKCQKSERMAASIEKQFKDARPNLKIDYSLMIEAEPSTQLMAALMFRDSDLEPPAKMKSVISPTASAKGGRNDRKSIIKVR